MPGIFEFSPHSLTVQETWVWSLDWEDSLEKGMATHSSILAWRIPWIEEPGGLQFMLPQSQTRLSDFHFHQMGSVTSMSHRTSQLFIILLRRYSLLKDKKSKVWKEGKLKVFTQLLDLVLISLYYKRWFLSSQARNNVLNVQCAVLRLTAQSCPTLCNPMDCSLPGSSVHGDSPGKNTGLGCHALLQGIFPTQGSSLGLPHGRQIVYQLSHQGSPWYKKLLKIVMPIQIKRMEIIKIDMI